MPVSHPCVATSHDMCGIRNTATPYDLARARGRSCRSQSPESAHRSIPYSSLPLYGSSRKRILCALHDRISNEAANEASHWQELPRQSFPVPELRPPRLTGSFQFLPPHSSDSTAQSPCPANSASSSDGIARKFCASKVLPQRQLFHLPIAAPLTSAFLVARAYPSNHAQDLASHAIHSDAPRYTPQISSAKTRERLRACRVAHLHQISCQMSANGTQHML